MKKKKTRATGDGARNYSLLAVCWVPGGCGSAVTTAKTTREQMQATHTPTTTRGMMGVAEDRRIRQARVPCTVHLLGHRQAQAP